MAVTATSISAIRTLITTGEAPAGGLSPLAAGSRVGLWALSADNRRCVAHRALLALWGKLPSLEEAVAAVVACEPAYRAPWQGILASRLREVGGRRDVDELCRMIEALGMASDAIQAQLPAASLAPTGHAEIERELFGAPTEQAVTLPCLLRAIASTADLVEGGQGTATSALPDLMPLDAGVNWVRGRLLQLPALDGPAPAMPAGVLSGSLAPLVKHELMQDEPAGQQLMRWVVSRPWALLLAHAVFTQEAWHAERIAGRVAFELDKEQLAFFSQPPAVRVVVTTPEGAEVQCGTIGELLHRAFTLLGVSLVAPGGEAQDLDSRLSPVIGLLLERDIWRFDDSASLGRRPGYLIHPEFSNLCYKAFGSRYFYRLGSLLTGAIRSACETWAREKLEFSRKEKLSA